MNALPRDYDTWRLAGPDDFDSIGTEDGEPCNRFPEPDEDAPRNWKSQRCDGAMQEYDGTTACDSCGALA